MIDNDAVIFGILILILGFVFYTSNLNNIFWKRFFKDEFFKFDKHKGSKILNIIPAAGEGKRHKELGYNLSLIHI